MNATIDNAAVKKEIAAIVKDHLARYMFGMEVEGEFRHDLGWARIVITVRNIPTAKGIIGDISVIHSEYGNWISYWKGAMRASAPRLRHDAEQIKSFIELKQTWSETVLWVFGVNSDNNTAEA